MPLVSIYVSNARSVTFTRVQSARDHNNVPCSWPVLKYSRSLL